MSAMDAVYHDNRVFGEEAPEMRHVRTETAECASCHKDIDPNDCEEYRDKARGIHRLYCDDSCADFGVALFAVDFVLRMEPRIPQAADAIKWLELARAEYAEARRAAR